MLVIYSDFGDPDTRVLTALWEGIDAKVIRIHKGSTSEDKIAMKKALEEEKDTVLFCGHGSGEGLWTPNICSADWRIWGGYAFSYKDISSVKAKNIVGIWCHASDFSRTFDVRGFYSSMFISNSHEARWEGINCDDDTITKSEILFCERVNKLLKENIPLNRWVDILRDNKLTNRVEEFNYGGLFYHA